MKKTITLLTILAATTLSGCMMAAMPGMMAAMHGNHDTASTETKSSDTNKPDNQKTAEVTNPSKAPAPAEHSH